MPSPPFIPYTSPVCRRRVRAPRDYDCVDRLVEKSSDQAGRHKADNSPDQQTESSARLLRASTADAAEDQRRKCDEIEINLCTSSQDSGC
jgi:hypothetical protein